jgi:pimeloyl-ACP methyl ester carboxylesterase
MTQADTGGGLQVEDVASVEGFDALADVERGTVETNGIDTHYVRRGSGQPIVFVHGMAMNATEWVPQLAALGDDYETVAYDVRGHGHTGGSDASEYTIDLFAEDLRALLDALDVEDPIVCGLSMGGAIAQVYAARYPEDVAGVVLADTFTAAPMGLQGRMLFANLKFLARLDRVVRYTTLNRLQTRIGNALSPGVAGAGTATQRIMETGPTIPHREFAKIARAVATFPRSDVDLAAITAPVLVVHGEHLPATMVAMADRIVDGLANAPTDTVVVPDAGHASNVDNPEVFTEAVRKFAEAVRERRD